jgi:hypothetical protein
MRKLLVFAIAFTATGALALACGSSVSPSAAGPTSTGAGGASSSGAGGTSAGGHGMGGLPLYVDGGGCAKGAPCGDGGVCAGGVCCDADHACADACCGSGQVCNFQACETPGATCVDLTDCPAGHFCDYSLGEPAGDAGADAGACQGGAKPATGRCMTSPPECAPGAPQPTPGAPLSCLPKCEYKPPTSDFTPVVKYAWGGVADGTPNDVMMAPIVVNLDDDDCNGKVDENDIPEIVFSTFAGGAYFEQGSLHAISPIGGKLVDKWVVPNAVQPGGGLAAGDLDGDGVPEIVACANPGPAGASCCDELALNTGVVAFRADGSAFWSQLDTSKVHCGYEAPAIGDVDQDGVPEVLVGWTLLDGKTGQVKKELDPGGTYGPKLTSLADLDGDGKLDVTDGQRAYRADGTVLWDLRSGPDAIAPGYHAIGDFDHDGVPEVVIVQSSGPHTLAVVHRDAAAPSGAKVLRKGVDINQGISTAAFCGAQSEYGGGPPTIADFDGDGVPDVGAAGAVGYVVLSGKKILDPNVADPTLWFQHTHDCSSAVTGSSVFDFNGDGKPEVVYSDEFHLWMYDGTTGQNLIPSTCNTTGTLWEYPLVADVDNDGQADLVVASNAYGITCPDDGSKQSGIRVFGSASGSWVRTRRIWNEHTYHITNIGEDGRVPKVEAPNWKQPGLDDFRQNRQPEGEFSAPDAIVAVAPRCTSPYALVATVTNIGSAALPAGVPVGFHAGGAGGALLGKGATSKTLHPAESEAVVLELPNVPADVTSGKVPVVAVVDDGKPQHAWHECRTDNDASPPASGVCAGGPK